MSDPDPVASAMATAAQSLRDTARWMVGGVVGTAAGIFAGSSLTAFGSLDPVANTLRLILAIGGLLVGFGALAVILHHAISVLTRESMTFREIASAGHDNLPEWVEVRARLLERYRDRLPPGAASFADYVGLVDQARSTNPQTPATAQLLARAREDNTLFGADGSFLFVRARFERLVCALWRAAPFAILGFALFAWAANPPKPDAAATTPRPADAGAGRALPAPVPVAPVPGTPAITPTGPAPAVPAPAAPAHSPAAGG